jgi:hypothetical protein
MGLKYDPSLLRCALRVATCHSRLGDFDEAFRCVGGLRDQVAGGPAGQVLFLSFFIFVCYAAGLLIGG